MADWFVNETLVEIPEGPSNARPVGKIWGRSGPGDFHQDISVHYMWPTVQALTYAAVCLGDNDLMTLASEYFESVTRYFQVSAGDWNDKDYNDPSTYSPIAFRMMQYPNSETKIMSNIALWGQGHMAARLLWDGTWWQ